MFGATGRNGGFCCLGGGKASDNRLDRLFGKDERLLYRAAEKEAVTLVIRFSVTLKSRPMFNHMAKPPLPSAKGCQSIRG